MKNREFAVMLAVLTVIGVVRSSLGLEASTQPPADIAVQDAPQFVTLGWDDNGYADGVQWICDYIQSKSNPAGNGNQATFDNSPVRCTFFVTGQYGFDNPVTATAWKAAYDNGNEIANHTYTHADYMQYSADVNVWLTEIGDCNTFLESIGIAKESVVGFRTPRLGYGTGTFTALDQMGFLYDCSIEDNFNLPFAGLQYFWPHTLDNGSVAPILVVPTGSHPNQWELYVYNWDVGGSSITGFDYNLWYLGSGMTKATFLQALKDNFHHHYDGNRSPLTLGLHSDYYSSERAADPEVPQPTGATVEERKAAIEEFIDYVLSFAETRIVPAKSIISWMQHPVALGEEPTAISPAAQGIPEQSARLTVCGTDQVYFALPKPAQVEIELLSASGQKLRRLFSGLAGQSSIKLPVAELGSGVYFVVMREQQGRTSVQRVVLANRP